MKQLERIINFCVRKDKIKRLMEKSKKESQYFEFINEFLHDTRCIKDNILHQMPLNRGLPIININEWFKNNEKLFYIGHGDLCCSEIKYTEDILEIISNDEDLLLFSIERYFGYYKNHENENYIIR